MHVEARRSNRLGNEQPRQRYSTMRRLARETEDDDGGREKREQKGRKRDEERLRERKRNDGKRVKGGEGRNPPLRPYWTWVFCKGVRVRRTDVEGDGGNGGGRVRTGEGDCRR